MTLLGDCTALDRGERAATDGHISGRKEGKGAGTLKRISCYSWSAVNKTRVRACAWRVEVVRVAACVIAVWLKGHFTVYLGSLKRIMSRTLILFKY